MCSTCFIQVFTTRWWLVYKHLLRFTSPTAIAKGLVCLISSIFAWQYLPCRVLYAETTVRPEVFCMRRHLQIRLPTLTRSHTRTKRFFIKSLSSVVSDARTDWPMGYIPCTSWCKWLAAWRPIDFSCIRSSYEHPFSTSYSMRSSRQGLWLNLILVNLLLTGFKYAEVQEMYKQSFQRNGSSLGAILTQTRCIKHEAEYADQGAPWEYQVSRPNSQASQFGHGCLHSSYGGSPRTECITPIERFLVSLTPRKRN